MNSINRIIVVCISVSFVLTGCWDRKEINDVALVAGTGIDKIGDKYLVTTQIPLPSQIGGTVSKGGGGGTAGDKSWYNDSSFGRSVREAIETQQKSYSRQLYFSHRRIVIIGEGLARAGIDTMMDVFIRVPQNRLSALAAVTKGSARDLFNVQAPSEQVPAEMMRELAQNSTKHPFTLKSLIQKLLADGLDPAVPVLAVYKTNPGPEGKTKSAVKIDGLAIFQNNKLTGFLEDRMAAYLLLAMEEASNPEISIDPPNGKGKISISFNETHTKLTPIIAGENITMKIEIRSNCSIIDNESDFDATADENIRKVEKHLADELKAGIENTVNILQTSYHSDPIGFGDAIHRHDKNAWKNLRDHWHEEYYPKVKVAVYPVISIEHSGSATKPFGVKEGELEK
jgi:spore germination protein KC